MKSFWSNLSSRARLILVGCFAALILLVIWYLMAANYYPIAFVNNSPISSRRFNHNYDAAALAYNNLLKIYEKNNTSPETKMTALDIQATVLTRLVEEELIREGVKKEAGEDLDYLVANKVSKYTTDEKLKSAAKTLYGLEFNDFMDEILVPQAEKDVLSGRLFLRGEKIEDWLATKKKDAKVSILANQFHWTGDKVEVAK